MQSLHETAQLVVVASLEQEQALVRDDDFEWDAAAGCYRFVVAGAQLGRTASLELIRNLLARELEPGLREDSVRGRQRVAETMVLAGKGSQQIKVALWHLRVLWEPAPP